MHFKLAFFLAALTAAAAQWPAGTPLTIRMVDEVNSRHHLPGQTFRATIDEPLVQQNGEVALRRGTPVKVRLAEVADTGRFKGRALLALVLTSIQVDGREVELKSYKASTSGGKRLRTTAAVVGGAAATGAVLGGGIGALAGAGAGSAFQMVHRGKSLRIPSESRLTFVLANPLMIGSR